MHEIIIIKSSTFIAFAVQRKGFMTSFLRRNAFMMIDTNSHIFPIENNVDDEAHPSLLDTVVVDLI